MTQDPLASMMTEARHTAQRWYDALAPEVSIVILNFNNAELTKLCLFNIWMHTAGQPYEIIVVDNGSADGDCTMLTVFAGPFTLLRLDTNRYFGEGNNIGAERAKGRLLIFLNNDAFVTRGWLAPLQQCHDAALLAGAVGPQFVYPGGRLQERGAFVDATGATLQIGKDQAPMPGDSAAPRIVDYCSAACLLLSRSLFQSLGGFDYRYEPAYYEDADLSFKIAASGRYTYCCPASTVVHIERATTSAHTALVGQSVLAANRQIFLDRWGDVLRARTRGVNAAPGSLQRDATLPWRASEPARATAAATAITRRQGRVAFSIGQDLVPGETVRILLAAAAAIAENVETLLITPLPYSRLRLEALAQDLGLDLQAVRLRSAAEAEAVGPIDLCVIATEGPLPPPACRGRRNVFVCQGPAAWYAIAISDRQMIDERLAFSHAGLALWREAADPACPVIVLPPCAAVPPYDTAPQAAIAAAKSGAPCKILTVGRFGSEQQSKRQDIAIEALRRLTAQGFDVELHCAGWLLPQPAHRRHLAMLRRLAEGLPVHFHPNTPGATLRRLLQDAQLYWQMTGYGQDPASAPQHSESCGIAVLDAMAASCVPIVVDSGGPLDVVTDGQTGFIYRTIDTLVERSAQMLAQPALRQTLGAAARAATQNHSQARFDAQWIALVERHLGQGIGSGSSASFVEPHAAVPVETNRIAACG